MIHSLQRGARGQGCRRSASGAGSAGWIGKGHIETTITIETLLYDITSAKLIWAGVSQTIDPKDVANFTTQLVKDVAKNLEKEKLIKKGVKSGK